MFNISFGLLASLQGPAIVVAFKNSIIEYAHGAAFGLCAKANDHLLVFFQNGGQLFELFSSEVAEHKNRLLHIAELAAMPRCYAWLYR